MKSNSSALNVYKKKTKKSAVVTQLLYGDTFKNAAPQQRHNLSVSGATEKSNYYVSLGFLNKKGWLNDDDHNINYDRYNILAKVSYEITDWLEMDTKALITVEENDEPHFYNWDVNINSFIRMGGRASYKHGSMCKLATKGKGRAYGKNS